MGKNRNHSRKYIGIVGSIKSFFLSKWILQNKLERVEFCLSLRNEEISDLNNRLEAYKDALAALNREYRLQGMIAESDLLKISQKKERDKS